MLFTKKLNLHSCLFFAGLSVQALVHFYLGPHPSGDLISVCWVFVHNCFSIVAFLWLTTAPTLSISGLFLLSLCECEATSLPLYVRFNLFFPPIVLYKAGFVVKSWQHLEVAWHLLSWSRLCLLFFCIYCTYASLKRFPSRGTCTLRGSSTVAMGYTERLQSKLTY